MSNSSRTYESVVCVVVVTVCGPLKARTWAIAFGRASVSEAVFKKMQKKASNWIKMSELDAIVIKTSPEPAGVKEEEESWRRETKQRTKGRAAPGGGRRKGERVEGRES